MHGFRILLSATASFLAIISYYPYIKGILRSQTKPNRASFFIWTAIGIVESISYLDSGGGITSGLLIAYTAGTAVIFLMSIKSGIGGSSTLDMACLLGAAAGIVGWLITRNPHVALICSLATGILGYLPTFKKAYVTPETENTSHWVVCGLAAICNIVAISNWSLIIISVPVYLLLCDGVLAFLTLFQKTFRRATYLTQ